MTTPHSDQPNTTPEAAFKYTKELEEKESKRFKGGIPTP
jgi:hypothetical protein